jgi:cation:H+ antiporter
MIIYSNWARGLIFIICAILIWVYGIKLSKSIETIVMHYGWGEAIGGIVFLAIITNLPEIAITAVAAFNHDYDIAVSNILGGITIQTAVLVLIDIYGVGRKAPLTLKGHSKILLFEGLPQI